MGQRFVGQNEMRDLCDHIRDTCCCFSADLEMCAFGSAENQDENHTIMLAADSRHFYFYFRSFCEAQRIGQIVIVIGDGIYTIAQA